MLTKSRLIQLVSMLSLLVGLFIWRTVDLSTDVEKNALVSDSTLHIEDKLCDFSQPCIFNSLWGDFSLSVDQGEIIPEQWFNLTLKSDLENWQVKSAKIVGKTMFMGKIPIKFSTVSNDTGENQAQAKTMLGVCTENKMLWRLEMLIVVDDQPVDIHYDFLIVK